MLNKQFLFNIYNSLEQLIKSGFLHNDLSTIPVDNLSNGLYFIEFISDHNYERQSFIVENQK